MTLIDTPEILIYTVIGVAAKWLFDLLRGLVQRSVEARRGEVDRMARLERDLEASKRHSRKLEESLHAHRIQMLNRGITQTDLPPFLPKDK